MSLRYDAGILTATYQPLKTPNAPTVGTITRGTTQVSVPFTAPANTGGGAITSYRVYVTNTSTGAITTNTGASSPIVVTGLTNDQAHTARVSAINTYGEGPQSGVSNSVTPSGSDQFAYTTAGTYSWIAPTGVTSVSVVAVGGGGGGQYYASGGGGGGLGYINNYSVTPNSSYTVVVGNSGTGSNANSDLVNGGNSYFVSTRTVKGGGGGGGSGHYSSFGAGGTGGTYTGDGGGNGGNGGSGGGSSGTGYDRTGGGGGAGGYAGNGGNGGNQTSSSVSGTAGSGGGGGGGASGWNSAGSAGGAGGGGVGLLGQGASGAAGTGSGSATSTSANGGGGGSGGGNGTVFSGIIGGGGFYGGGGVGGDLVSNSAGARGAVRIIWPGATRSFPSTNTGDA